MRCRECGACARTIAIRQPSFDILMHDISLRLAGPGEGIAAAGLPERPLRESRIIPAASKLILPFCRYERSCKAPPTLSSRRHMKARPFLVGSKCTPMRLAPIACVVMWTTATLATVSLLHVLPEDSPVGSPRISKTRTFFASPFLTSAIRTVCCGPVTMSASVTMLSPKPATLVFRSGQWNSLPLRMQVHIRTCPLLITAMQDSSPGRTQCSTWSVNFTSVFGRRGSLGVTNSECTLCCCWDGPRRPGHDHILVGSSHLRATRCSPEDIVMMGFPCHSLMLFSSVGPFRGCRKPKSFPQWVRTSSTRGAPTGDHSMKRTPFSWSGEAGLGVSPGVPSGTRSVKWELASEGSTTTMWASCRPTGCRATATRLLTLSQATSPEGACPSRAILTVQAVPAMVSNLLA
mmetsp:Transcript_25792/g.72213  ORF Transcript_25792/g.72213 Transcript_25792/m.72213 type:complete len:405 (-) Transcript_25792:155-1369(-)